MDGARPGGRPRSGERGQVLILAAVMLTTLLAASGIAVDLGVARVERQSAQSAADAAAVAGADDLPGSSGSAVTDATATASAYDFTTGVDNVSVTVQSPPQASLTHDGDTNSVEVIITRQVPTFLLRAVGLSSVTVRAQAVATATGTSGSAPCVLCVLSPTASDALLNNGNPSVTITGGGVTVDSKASQAMLLNGNASLSAASIGVVGGLLVNGNDTLSPTPVTGVLPVTDPLAAVPPPALSGPKQGSVSLVGNGSRTLSPGIYTGISVTGNGTLDFNPGTYVITGPVSLTGNPNLVGQGVTLYFTCSAYSATDTAPCNGSSGSSLVLDGNPTYDLTAPTSGTYQGLTVFYDRGNTAVLTLNGNGSDDFTGTIYAKDAAATLNGNPGIDQVDSLVIVNTCTLNGNGALNIAFNQAQNYALPPTSGGAALTE